MGEPQEFDGCYGEVLVAEGFFDADPTEIQRSFYETQAIMLGLTEYSIVDITGVPPEFLCRPLWRYLRGGIFSSCLG